MVSEVIAEKSLPKKNNNNLVVSSLKQIYKKKIRGTDWKNNVSPPSGSENVYLCQRKEEIEN